MSISYRDKHKVIGILNGVLGAGTSGKGDNQLHYCPFCGHHKKKLEVHVSNQKWHCWVCDAKGTRIFSLLKRLQVDNHTLSEIKRIYGDTDTTNNKVEDEPKIELKLPREFISLSKKPDRGDYQLKNALKYVHDRGITDEDIIKHNIGFCKTGLYAGRVIIPSYNENGELNYFIARTIFDNESFKYKNPPVSKNVLALGNQINWDLPITLVEGIFDAIAVRRNVIPLFGKFIPKVLRDAILKNRPPELKIMLDSDAQAQALKYVEYFNKQGIKTSNIIPIEKDASEMGFDESIRIIENTKRTGFDDLIEQKLKLI